MQYIVVNFLKYFFNRVKRMISDDLQMAFCLILSNFIEIFG